MCFESPDPQFSEWSEWEPWTAADSGLRHRTHEQLAETVEFLHTQDYSRFFDEELEGREGYSAEPALTAHQVRAATLELRRRKMARKR
jgi:hypothetical protein